MSPFLAQVQVMNVAGKPAHSADEVIEAARVIANQALDAARTAADAAVTNVQSKSYEAEPEAPIKKDSSDKDNDGTDEKTVRVSKDGVVVVKHKKSSSDDNVPAVVVPCVAIFFVFSYLIVRALMAPFSNRNRRGAAPPVVMGGLSAEETALLEKLQRTLMQMESRVESLETILIDQARTKEKYGTKL